MAAAMTAAMVAETAMVTATAIATATMTATATVMATVTATAAATETATVTAAAVVVDGAVTSVGGGGGCPLFNGDFWNTRGNMSTCGGTFYHQKKKKTYRDKDYFHAKNNKSI